MNAINAPIEERGGDLRGLDPRPPAAPRESLKLYALLDAYEHTSGIETAREIAALKHRGGSDDRMARRVADDQLAIYCFHRHRGFFDHSGEPAAPIAARWHSVPPGADGPELRHDELPVRLLADGRVLVWDPYRKLHMEAPQRATNLAEAASVGIETLFTIEMREDVRREIEARERERQRGYGRDRANSGDQVREIRRRLDDPVRVVTALGLERGARRQPRGVTICCPAHDDKTPSCSVRVAKDDTIACRCHGCGWSGDVFGLIAAAHHLDVRRDFRRVLTIAADLAGVQIARAA